MLEISYNLDYDITIMPRIDLTPELFGSLGETYYKEYCVQKGWAYTSLEQIYKNLIHNCERMKKNKNYIKKSDMSCSQI